MNRLAHSSYLGRQWRKLLPPVLVTLLATLMLSVYALPISYMFVTGLKSQEMISDPAAPILWPAQEAEYIYQEQSYPLYHVPTEKGTERWALIEKGRESSIFIDPDNPERGLIEWEGRWRQLEPVWRFQPVWENFSYAWEYGRFGLLLRNTLLLAAIGVTGTLVSSVLVAYGFARFEIPGQNLIFALLIGSLMLPQELLQIPLYTLFYRIGWVGTWLPLLVPQFFANALYVFLLRQHFRTLSKELDEAALIDGARPFRILISVILPQSVPVIATVILLQFFYIWRDFYTPVLYLASNYDLRPISLGIAAFGQRMTSKPEMVHAASMFSLIIPAVVFLFTQGYIMKGARSILGISK